MHVKISSTAPLEYAGSIREAMGQVGAGAVGEYSFCSFSMSGQGRFLPSKNASLHIGEAGMLEIVEEEKIEVVYARDNAMQVIAALRNAHPYEEPIVDIVPLIEEV